MNGKNLVAQFLTEENKLFTKGQFIQFVSPNIPYPLNTQRTQSMQRGEKTYLNI